MKINAIACQALTREIRLASAYSPHTIDIELLDFGLHCTPDKLRQTIQERIDAGEGRGYDAIILGYGLCSRGTAEIEARSIPIVIPRMHDCITAILGSRRRYNEEFTAHPGTYYYSAGWIERSEGDMRQGFIDDAKAVAEEERYRQYVEKYGEDNAKFLIEQEQQCTPTTPARRSSTWASVTSKPIEPSPAISPSAGAGNTPRSPATSVSSAASPTGNGIRTIF